MDNVKILQYPTVAWKDPGPRKNYIATVSNKKIKFFNWNTFTLNLVKCCKYTSFHGFKYLADSKSSTFERLLWLCLIGAGIFATYSTITVQVKQYLSKPIFLTHQAFRTPLQDIPFPAVTVCSENKINPSVLNYSALTNKPRHLLSAEEGERTVLNESYHKYFEKLVLRSFFKKKVELCQDEIKAIKWQNVELNPPCHYLQHFLTSIGHCSTFNMMSISQIYKPNISVMAYSYFPLANGSFNNNTEEDFWIYKLNETPWASRDPSIEGGLILTLNFRSIDYEENCNFRGKHFTVIVHSPEEPPNGLHSFHSVRVNSIGLINTEPHLSLASPSTEALPPSQRGCYLPHERYLRFYNLYNERNCEMECLVNQTFQKCGCMPYNYPKEKHVPICGFHSSYLQCFSRIIWNSSDDCNCLPNCRQFSYTTSLTAINKKIPFDEKFDMAIVAVKLSKKGVTARVSHSITENVEVMGNLGGLASVFLGASVMSLLELVYLCSLRPLVVFWNLRRARRIAANSKHHN